MFWSGKSGHRPGRELHRVLADFLVALALFWAVTLAVSGDHTRAHAVPLAGIGADARHRGAVAPREASFRAGESRAVLQDHRKAARGRQQALVLLSLAFAAIIACNLAFWRHLRRVYASPRRSVWGRGRQG